MDLIQDLGISSPPESTSRWWGAPHHQKMPPHDEENCGCRILDYIEVVPASVCWSLGVLISDSIEWWLTYLVVDTCDLTFHLRCIVRCSHTCLLVVCLWSFLLKTATFCFLVYPFFCSNQILSYLTISGVIQLTRTRAPGRLRGPYSRSPTWTLLGEAVPLKHLWWNYSLVTSRPELNWALLCIITFVGNLHLTWGVDLLVCVDWHCVGVLVLDTYWLRCSWLLLEFDNYWFRCSWNNLLLKFSWDLFLSWIVVVCCW